jgi:hypothetical protein
VWGGGRRRGLPYCLITLAAAAIALPLNFGGDGRDKGGGKVGVCEFGSLDNRGVGKERRRSSVKL